MTLGGRGAGAAGRQGRGLGGGGQGKGIALCKIFVKPKMNQIGAKVGNNEVLKT